MDGAERLIEQGQNLLKQGDFQGAAQSFAAALKEDDAVPIRNNLALSLFMAGKPEEALEALQPALNAEDKHLRANAFSYALASRICCSLGREEEARRWLNQAVQSFETGLSEMLHTFKKVPATFCEYTAIIMRAAADLKDHRQVFELYRRWEPYHVSWENKFLAGVACFNLGRYKRAAGLWASIAEVHHLFDAMQQVAFLVERGVIPPFAMSYNTYEPEEIEKMLKEAATDEEARRRCWQDGYILMALLSYILKGEDKQEAGKMAYSLAAYAGEWGEKLGWKILDSPVFDRVVKMGVAQAFVERGLLKENEPVRMNIDGEERLVEIKKTPIVLGPNKKLDAIVEKAFELRDKGQVDEAIKLLQDLYFQGTFYPRAMMALANLLRQKGELEEAFKIMQMLEELAPEDPAVLFNFAALMLQMDNIQEARDRLNKIDRRGLSKEFLEKLKLLEEQIEAQDLLLNLPHRLVELYEEEERRLIEEKSLPVDPSLSRGLKNMPANWLDAACLSYGLKPARVRREREKQLIDFLTRRENLERVVQELEREEWELLEYLLQKGGWSRLNAVTRKFGSLEGDGFYWEEEAPGSPLGFLWSRALVMVGKAYIEGKRAKIAAIPIELRQPLKEILGINAGV